LILVRGEGSKKKIATVYLLHAAAGR